MPPKLDSKSDAVIDQIAQQVQSRLLAKGLPLHNLALQETKTVAFQKPTAKPEKENQMATMPRTAAELASFIDHTLLKADATETDIEKLCSEAKKHHFATCCVNSAFVGKAAAFLKGSSVKAIAVVGFPLGAASSASKAFEAQEAIKNGAQEIDMVINIGELKSANYSLVQEDIRAVVEASKPFPVKVILETALLNQEQKIIACALSKAAGAAFVKTSTGFGPSGATTEDIALMRRVVGPSMGVKASGGIRTTDDALQMIAAGANRVGASASVAIVAAFEPNAKTENEGRKPFTGLPYKAGKSKTPSSGPRPGGKPSGSGDKSGGY